MGQRCTLSVLRPGEKAVIVKVNGRGQLRRRMVEMGITSGKTVEVERVAPLGDPTEILVMGYHVSLRKTEMDTVEVEVLP